MPDLRPPGKETGIGRTPASPIASIGVLALGLILPVVAGPLTGQAAAAIANTAEAQTKSVTLVRDGRPELLHTRAVTVADLFLERNITLHPEDLLDAEPASAVVDGETIRYEDTVPVTLVVDNFPTAARTTAATVGAFLAEAGVSYDRHDRVTPAASTPLTSDLTIRVEHLAGWVESVRVPVAPPVKRLASFDLPAGVVRVVAAGSPGLRELSYRVTRDPAHAGATRRSLLAARIIRAPRARVLAAGVGEYAALSDLAKRGFAGTIHLARSAIRMLATAYTAQCYGCSGVTILGHHAGHGIVAVDPRIIPLGSRLYIPGYGRATAGDTGGAIQGHRIDLGFDNNADALRYGVRQIVVYVVK
jgi:3D (Asp-Asp-Asp) domain-containing protein/uncharacterized protein YabE (DUF348 family)